MATPLKRALENLRAGEAMFRDVGRLRQILGVLARHGFGAFVQQLRLRDEWVVRKLLELQKSEAEPLPLERRVSLAVQELGPTFVKLGQILSTRPDVLPAGLIEELRTLQDAVAPMAIDEVRTVIRSDLGGSPDDLFDDFDPTPLASASIAQVHRARLKGPGTDVVVKVQRPNIRGQVEADLEIMAFLARGLEANFPEAALYSPAGIVNEFARAIRRELDFTHEIDHIERFRRNFLHNRAVHFPRPFPAFSTTRVLTMEYVDGTKITAMTPDRFDVDRVVRTALDAILQMIHIDGFFHGDLHPGNLLVREDGALCFIDFGLCGRLTRRQREHLVDMLIALVRQNFTAVARAFWRIGVHGKDSTREYERFERDVVDCLEDRFGGKTVREIEFSAFFRDLVGLSLKHRIRMPPDYTMTFKAVITMEGVAKQLCPELDMADAVRPYMRTLLAERYGPRRLFQDGYEALVEATESLGRLPETARAILEDLRAGRAQLNLEINQWTELQRNYARTQHRNTLAMLAAISALCGTLALDHAGCRVFGLSGVSFWFFVAAAVLLLRYARGGAAP